MAVCNACGVRILVGGRAVALELRVSWGDDDHRADWRGAKTFCSFEHAADWLRDKAAAHDGRVLADNEPRRTPYEPVTSKANRLIP